MYKKLIVGLSLMLASAITVSAPLENSLRDTLQRAIQPSSKVSKRPVTPGLNLTLSDFRIQWSGNRAYWFATLENSSSLEARKNQLEVTARQYDRQNNSKPAGREILNTQPIRSGGSLQLQREFEPMNGANRVRIEIRDRSKNRRLLSQTFQADMRKIKPVTQLPAAVAKFSGKMQARIRSDEKNFLWYVDIKNVGRAALNFKDYDFHITPSIRGVQTGREPFTDVRHFDEQSLQPGKSFRIYVATGYDSCFSGDLINAHITHRESGSVINLFQPIEQPLYQVKGSTGLFDKSSQIRYWDFNFDIPLITNDLPPYYDDGYIYGDIHATERKGGRHQFSFNHVGHTTGLKLPPELTFSDGISDMMLELKWFASFCGRNVLIKAGRGYYEDNQLRDMEKPATIEVK